MVYPGLRRNRLKWSKRRVAFSKYLLDRCTHTHIHTQHIHTRTHDTMQGPVGLLGTRPFCIPQFFNLIYFIYLFLAVLGLCCCMLAFFSCSKKGLLSSCSEQASH